MVKARSAPDIWLLISILLILFIGLMMVYSASAVLAFHEFGDKFYFLKRQSIFAGLGLMSMFFMMNVNYS
ncbi:MAG TPA: FtsW/RodA/SpoVE family cell cycle protein, partial [Candidatus Paenibacillus intestinavium]|nr:FtsW/RodA/SpoVE family cell cycle protein [Candidatus Paenibacillus intestinavium]